MKPKILILIDWYTPGFKAGGPIRSCSNIVQHLSSEFDFSIITSDTDYCETQPYDSIHSEKWNILDDGSKVFYIPKSKENYSYLKKIITSTDFDYIFINGIYSKIYSIYPLLILKNSTKPIIVSIRGMLAASAIGIKSYKKKPFLFIASFLGLYKNVTFHATNNKEQQDVFTSIGKNSQVKVAPNLPKLKKPNQNNPIKKTPGTLNLISLARISPEKNLLQLLHTLKAQKGIINLDLYGTIYDEKYWSACQKIIKELPQDITVNYKGVIHPDLIELTIKNYHFMCLLTLGENFGHVILESFMADRPVIISDQTPWRDLSIKKIGWDINLNDKEKLHEVFNLATQMGQIEFDQMIINSKAYSQAIIEDKVNINKTRLLFN